MEPVFGFLLYFAATGIATAVAVKRGRSGWLVSLCCLGGGFALVRLIAGAGGSGTAAGLGAFLMPIGALAAVLASPSSEQQAILTGQHGKFRKCPYCAEAIRAEAVKCKHCGSTLTAEQA